MSLTSEPRFWRDPRMPWAELRQVEDGRRVCYAPHSHTQWSMGAITGGCSTFLYRNQTHRIQPGDLVLINPDQVHACNPVQDQPWSYFMLYVDTGWLTRLRYEAGLLTSEHWQDLTPGVLSDPVWHRRYCLMAHCLMDADRDLLEKQEALVTFLSDLMVHLAETAPEPETGVPETLKAVAGYLNQNATSDISLDELCDRSGYSPGYLIRAFRQHFHLTPHAYLVNRRIQLGQVQLKQGQSIAHAALEAGFADQPHFQRTFKRLTASTPNQYRKV